MLNDWKVHRRHDIACKREIIYFTNSTVELAGQATVTRRDLMLPVEAMPPITIGRCTALASSEVLVPDDDFPVEQLEPWYDGKVGAVVQDYGPRLRRVRLMDLLRIKAPPKQLIVDPDQVSSLLERIVDLQRPIQKELRKKDAKQMQRVEAEILTFGNYRP